MIDASIVEVPIQRNSRDENQQLNEGIIPPDWKDEENKLRQKILMPSGLPTMEKVTMDIKIK